MFKKRLHYLIAFSSMMILSLSCSLSLDTAEDKEGDGSSSAEQTIQAIYVAGTLQPRENLEQSNEESIEVVAEEPMPTQIPHAIIPGNPGPPTQQQDEINTSNTASKRIALGDSFRLGIFERPFTQNVMDYKKENDILDLKVAEDENFYFFLLQISGPGEDGTISAHYGI